MSLSEINSTSSLSVISTEIARLEGLPSLRPDQEAQLAYLTQIAKDRNGQETPFLEMTPDQRLSSKQRKRMQKVFLDSETFLSPAQEKAVEKAGLLPEHAPSSKPPRR